VSWEVCNAGSACNSAWPPADYRFYPDLHLHSAVLATVATPHA